MKKKKYCKPQIEIHTFPSPPVMRLTSWQVDDGTKHGLKEAGDEEIEIDSRQRTPFDKNQDSDWEW